MTIENQIEWVICHYFLNLPVDIWNPLNGSGPIQFSTEKPTRGLLRFSFHHLQLDLFAIVALLVLNSTISTKQFWKFFWSQLDEGEVESTIINSMKMTYRPSLSLRAKHVDNTTAMEFAAGWVLNSQFPRRRRRGGGGGEGGGGGPMGISLILLVWLVAFVGIVISQFWSDERTKWRSGRANPFIRCCQRVLTPIRWVPQQRRRIRYVIVLS